LLRSLPWVSIILTRSLYLSIFQGCHQLSQKLSCPLLKLVTCLF
jgi:hypothetical protein